MTNIRTSLPFPTRPWEAAKANFLNGLSEEEQDRFKNATLENIFYNASAAQKRYAQGSKSWVFQERLTSLVEGIEDYGKALDVFVNASPLVLSPLWGSIRVVLHIAGEAGKFQEKLVDMLASIGDALPRFHIYQTLYHNHERLLAALSAAYLDILRFCTLTKDFFARTKRTYIPLAIVCRGAWKPFRQQFDIFMNGFREHKSRVREEARIAHFIEAAKAREIEIANRQLQKRNARISRRHRLISLLPTVEYQAKHQRLLRLWQAGTNKWIQAHPSYKSWLASPRSDCLCVYGIPGSGKSILAANVIEHLMTLCPSGSFAVCYYYCDYADASSLDLTHIVGTLIKQLLLQLPLATFDGSLFKSIEDSPSTANLIDRAKGLPVLLAYFASTYIVLDGIDELAMETQEACLDLIKQMLRSQRSNVRIYVTSRREERIIRSSLEIFKTIDLTLESIDEDIALFVEAAIDSGFLQHNPVTRRPEVRQRIVEALVNGAQGMFLWVKFQLHDLRAALTEAAIDDTLRALPKDLSQTYARIIKRIYDSPGGNMKFETMRAVFQWVLCARRPLLIEELEEAVALRPTDTHLHLDRVATDAGQSLVSACGNLVNYDRTDRTITFAHHSVQQYLCREGSFSEITASDDVYFDRYLTELDIGETCIAYLCFSDFQTQLTKARAPAFLDQSKAEYAIWHQVPLSTHIRKVITSFASWGTSTPDSTLAPMQFAIPVPTPVQDSSKLASKYVMLEYVIEHWAHHTRYCSVLTSYWPAFKHVAFTLQLGFEFRPWNLEHQHNQGTADSTSPPWFPVYVWALKKGLTSLLELTSTIPNMIEQLMSFLECGAGSVEPRQLAVGHVAIRSVIAHCNKHKSIQDSFWTGDLIYSLASPSLSLEQPPKVSSVEVLRFLGGELLLRSETNATSYVNSLFDEAVLLAVERNDPGALDCLLRSHSLDLEQLSQNLIRIIRNGHKDLFPIKKLLTYSDPLYPFRVYCTNYEGITVEVLDALGKYVDQILHLFCAPEMVDTEHPPPDWEELLRWLDDMHEFFKWVVAVRMLVNNPENTNSRLRVSDINELVPILLYDKMGIHFIRMQPRWISTIPRWNICTVALRHALTYQKTWLAKERDIWEWIIISLLKTNRFNAFTKVTRNKDCLAVAVKCRMVFLVDKILSEYLWSDLRIKRETWTAYIHTATTSLRIAMRNNNPCLEVMLKYAWPRETVARAIQGGLDENLPQSVKLKLLAMAKGENV